MPSNTQGPTPDVVPTTIVTYRSVNDAVPDGLLRALLDSGGTRTMIHKQVVPNGCTATPLQQPMTATTINGTFDTTHYVLLRGLTLPELDPHKVIDQQDALLFDGPCQYDIILGRDFLHSTGMTLDFEAKEVRWLDLSIAMKNAEDWNNDTIAHAMVEDHVDQELDQHNVHIADAKYDKVDPAAVAAQQQHLSEK